MIRTQNTNSGRYELRGFPYWQYERDDDSRTIKVKAAKNIISAMKEWKDQGLDATGKKPGSDHMQSYQLAIDILKEEGEKYP